MKKAINGPAEILGLLLCVISAGAAPWQPIPQAHYAHVTPQLPEQHLLVTACTEISPRGRSVVHSRVVSDPVRACQSLTDGPNAHVVCGDEKSLALGAFGTVQVTNAGGVALWSCVIHD